MVNTSVFETRPILKKQQNEPIKISGHKGRDNSVESDDRAGRTEFDSWQTDFSLLQLWDPHSHLNDEYSDLIYPGERRPELGAWSSLLASPSYEVKNACSSAFTASTCLHHTPGSEGLYFYKRRMEDTAGHGTLRCNDIIIRKLDEGHHDGHDMKDDGANNI
jgi:hypothetical protein